MISKTFSHNGFTMIQKDVFSITVPGFETIIWESSDVTQKMVQDFIDRIPAHNKYPVMIISRVMYYHILNKFCAGFIYANKGEIDTGIISYRISEHKSTSLGFIEKPQPDFLLVVTDMG